MIILHWAMITGHHTPTLNTDQLVTWHLITAGHAINGLMDDIVVEYIVRVMT